ncbi:hypothetical protein KP509_34G056500 [Ceratopteris richardii]|uniref:CCR4-NOT transcription complex subunit 1 n=1 Tax=Ceratopteris richardii TaxID=49495 RepID=A0A8T2QLW2_CERRI|nr:hypothetical protein KP509_34G056500 [Ceratopteris richardii]
MPSFAASLATQISFLVESLTTSNFNSVLYEFSLLSDYGTTSDILMLRACLKEVNSQGEVQNFQLKIDLLAIVLRHLIHQPNFSSIFCEAVLHLPYSESQLEDLSETLKLSLLEQIGLGLALTDAENLQWQQQGYKLCHMKIAELCQNPAIVRSETVIDQILLFLHESDGLSRHIPAFTSCLPVGAHTSLLLMPLLQDDLDESKWLRGFDAAVKLPCSVSMDLMEQLENAEEAAGVLEELGYNCTTGISQCKEFLSLFPILDEKCIARIVAMVSRTHMGLEDGQGSFGTFLNAFGFNVSVDGPSVPNTWNIENLVNCLKSAAPGTDWGLVVDNFDHEGFYLPDQKSFNVLLGIYGMACKDPFPIEKICAGLWKNTEGQISFLKYAVLASSDILQFARSYTGQFYLELGNDVLSSGTHKAWLSIPLLKVLCELAEIGHAGAVRSILEHPMKHCPDILLLGIVQVKTIWNLIQNEILASLFPMYLGSNLNNSPVFRHLWRLNSSMVIRGFLEVHSKDPMCIPRILDVCQELQLLLQVLEAAPFSFSIDLATSASRRGILNLEKWLLENLSNHGAPFFKACLKYLRERAAGEAPAEILGGSGNRSGTASSLPLEIVAIIFKALQSSPNQLIPRDLLDEMKRVHNVVVQVNPRLLSAGASVQSTSESFSSDIEQEANSYFRSIYAGELPIEKVVTMLEQFKESRIERDKEVFACMLQSLFDEYRFFPKYPERELRITASLFGSLIKHQLVSSLTLGIALRYVLDALRKPLDSRMFSFGLAALEKFKDRLVEWPQYCNHILQISHIREAHSGLVEFIERALARLSAEPNISHTVPSAENPPSSGQTMPLATSTVDNMEVGEAFASSSSDIQPQQHVVQQNQIHNPLNIHDDKMKSSSLTALSFSKPFVSTSSMQLQHSASTNQLYDSGNAQKSSQTSQPGTFQVAPTAGFPRPTPTKGPGFGHALNIGTLVAAAERRDTPIEAPSSDVQDKIAFIINNISAANLDTKAKEFTEVLKEQYYPWFAQYMVMKRASIEPNFHDTYLKFLDKVNSRTLHKEVVKATYENCKVLLRSDLIKSSSEERSLLKNLGSWLGKLTIGRNQALRAIEIDPKVLITEAYERGLMIAVIPFTSKILEPCQSSLAYQPPNPWTMGILSLLAEIYNLPNLKMNLKFDIEVLFKNLGVDMKDVKVSQLLKGRPREIEGNPDFSNKDAGITHTPALYTSETTSASAIPAHVDLTVEASVSASHPAQLGSSHIPAGLTLPEEEKLGSLSLGERLPSGQGLAQVAGLPVPYSVNQISMSLPNLSSYVVINPKLAALGQQLHLSRIVPAAMERAIKEIISPVVERSVTIACMTTRELVMKDYAMESDESRICHSGNLMVASLAGSLAHVTCKEPLRAAMATHLRSMLQGLSITGDVLDSAVLLITNDNLDLGCAVIEKSATEKALHDLDDVMAPPLTVRRKQRETMGANFYDASFYSQGHLSRLPEALRPKPGRLTNAQQRVYEDFARLPWQNQPSQGGAASVASAVSSSTPAALALARSGYPQQAQGVGPYSGMPGVQPTVVSGVSTQSAESGTDDIELRMSVAASHTQSGQMLVPDAISHQTLEGTSSAGNVTGATLFVDMPSSDRQPPGKDSTTTSLSTSISPSLTVEQVSLAPIESSLSIGEAQEKFQLITQKLDVAISKGISIGLSTPSQDPDIQPLIMEVPEVISQCISKDEAALAFAQKAFKRLYENSSSLHIGTYLVLLALIRDVCKRVVKEITSWVMYSEEERKYNLDVVVGLIRSELIQLTDYNVYLAKSIDGGRNSTATEFAIHLVQTLVVQENLVSGIELLSVIESLGKVAQRPGASEPLQRLLEFLKSSSNLGQSGSLSGKEDKVRLSKEKRPSSRGSGSVREEGKAIMKETTSIDPAGLQEQVTMMFEEWLNIWDSSASQNDKSFAVYISKLQHLGMLKGDDITDRFFRIWMELAVAHCLNTETQIPITSGLAFQQQGISFVAIDAYARLIVLLVKYYGVDPLMTKINLLNKVLSVTVRVIQKVADEKKANFYPRPYFRLFVMLLLEFNSPDPQLEASNFQILTSFANAFMQLHPLRVPGWSFAWLELISHRMFMPKLMLSNSQKGWPFIQRLLVALFKFMEPFLRNADLSDPVRTLYKGTLRVLLVLLHDFPEFLSDNHFSFCDVIPASCIQLRNLILSAFPRNMRLPDPFTPNLKVDLLPEIGQSPRILSDVEFALKNKQLKSEIDEYLKTRSPLSHFLSDLKQRLMLLPSEVQAAGTRYNVPLINALVLYVGMQAIQQLQSKTAPQQLAVPTAPITHSAPMDIYQKLIVELDTEGRYLFLNAVANQLRYPNNHTHYFSCVLLYLFAEANQEIIQEQITRVLLERLIVNRPHPWGLLITFIELIKNPRYNFWSHGFTRCAPEIEKLFESVARSCVGPPLKSVDDDLSSSIGADGLKA